MKLLKIIEEDKEKLEKRIDRLERKRMRGEIYSEDNIELFKYKEFKNHLEKYIKLLRENKEREIEVDDEDLSYYVEGE